MLVRIAGIEARIYFNPQEVRGELYDSFLVKTPDPLRGWQTFNRFSTLKAAKAFAEEKCRLIANGQASVAVLTNEDAAHLGEARELLRPLGIELHVAVRAHAEALKELPAGVTLLDAVRFYASRHPSEGARKLVPEVVAEYIQDRESAGVSEIHLRDLRIRLGRFGEAFQIPVSGVTPAMVGDYLKALTNALNGKPSSPRSRANHRALIISLFNYARLRH